MIRERLRPAPSGLLVLPMVLLGLGLGITGIVLGLRRVAGPEGGSSALLWLALLWTIAFFVSSWGFFMVSPNEGKVLQLFGDYKGTVREQGLRWANPFYSKRGVSLRVRNFDSERLKVNDRNGNPIEIAAVVVWKVVDTAEALFQVDDYQHFVRIQTESAVRHLAAHHPYDQHDEGEVSLRSHAEEVAQSLKEQIQTRLAQAGVEVVEARLSHLAYAPEIAGVMLQRQQANAIIAARSRIVEGAVGMVEMALALLSDKGVVTLDEERKAAMVSNLLVVLCGDRGTQPVVSTGMPSTSR